MGGIKVKQHKKASGAPFAAGSANEGLQVNPFNGKIQLGEEHTFATGLAQLFSDREIIMDAFSIFLTLLSNNAERLILGSRNIQIETDFAATGHRPNISLTDQIVSFTITTNGTDRATLGGGSASMIFFPTSGSVQIAGGAPPADNGAKLQIQGDLTTADPGAGSGKWILGKKIAGAAVLDGANFVQVMVDGVLVKLAIVV